MDERSMRVSFWPRRSQYKSGNELRATADATKVSRPRASIDIGERGLAVLTCPWSSVAQDYSNADRLLRDTRSARAQPCSPDAEAKKRRAGRRAGGRRARETSRRGDRIRNELKSGVMRASAVYVPGARFSVSALQRHALCIRAFRQHVELAVNIREKGSSSRTQLCFQRLREHVSSLRMPARE